MTNTELRALRKADLFLLKDAHEKKTKKVLEASSLSLITIRDIFSTPIKFGDCIAVFNHYKHDYTLGRVLGSSEDKKKIYFVNREEKVRSLEVETDETTDKNIINAVVCNC